MNPVDDTTDDAASVPSSELLDALEARWWARTARTGSCRLMR
jgi:hypothetical protein